MPRIDEPKLQLDRTSGPSFARGLVIAAAFVVVIAGLKASQSIVVPFLLAVFIGILVTPWFTFMRDRGVPTIVSLLLMIALIVGVGFGVVTLVGSTVTDFTAKLPTYQERLQGQTTVVVEWLEGHGIEVADDAVRDVLNPNAAMRFAGGLVGSLSTMVSNAFLIILTVVFILLEASVFRAKMHALPGVTGDTLERTTSIMASVRHYVAIKTMTSVLTGAAIWIWLAILGVPFAPLWGLLAFLLNYVPNIGSIIAAVPAVLIALVENGFGSAMWTIVAFVVVNGLIGNLLEPRVMGKGLGLSVLVVFLSLIFWGWVLGPIGMVLSVPLTMTAKIVLDADADTRWLAVMLGSGPRATRPS